MYNVQCIMHEAAHQPHHTRTTADWDGRHSQCEVGANYANWKSLMKVDFKRVVLIVESWKGCPRLRNEYWFSQSDGRIWYKQ